MKIFLLILLLPFLAHAQDTTRRENKGIVLALITTSVITNAIGDGMDATHRYAGGHLLVLNSIVDLLAIPFFIKPTWKFPVSYMLIRYALFDGFYNLGANRPLKYEGGKNFYDEAVIHVPTSVLNFSKVAALGLTVVINLKK